MKALFPHVAVTGGVTVRVVANYLAEQSDPAASRWFWTYHIRVENGDTAPVQLLTRYWRISDGRGNVHEVRGEGVIGDQPVIEPGTSYDYVSGCPLATPTGAMEGSYGMIAADRAFDVAIPRFPLIGPAVAR